MYTNFQIFWGSDVFGSVKWYRMPHRQYSIIPKSNDLWPSLRLGNWYITQANHAGTTILYAFRNLSGTISYILKLRFRIMHVLRLQYSTFVILKTLLANIGLARGPIQILGVHKSLLKVIMLYIGAKSQCLWFCRQCILKLFVYEYILDSRLS